MTEEQKKLQMERYLLEEQAKADALYPYTENSPEPVLNGAWKGALLSGIGKTLHEAHKQGRLSLKGTLAYYLGGGLVGGAAGYLMNKQKVKKAKQARQFLVDNRINSYVKEKAKLIKESAAIPPDEKAKILAEAGMEAEEQKKQKPSIIKNIATNAGIGTALGGAMSFALNKFKFGAPVLRGAATLGVLSGTQAGLGQEIDDEFKEHDIGLSPAMQMAIAMGASSATEPLTYRLIGRLAGKNVYKFFTPEELSDLKKAQRQYAKDSAVDKIISHLTPNQLKNKVLKSKYDSDLIDLLQGHRGKIFDKQMLGHTLGKALWGGILGYGIGKAVDYLNKKNQKTANS